MTNIKVNKLIGEEFNRIVPNIIDRIIDTIEGQELSNKENSLHNHKQGFIDK